MDAKLNSQRLLLTDLDRLKPKREWMLTEFRLETDAEVVL